KAEPETSALVEFQFSSSDFWISVVQSLDRCYQEIDNGTCDVRILPGEPRAVSGGADQPAEDSEHQHAARAQERRAARGGVCLERAPHDGNARGRDYRRQGGSEPAGVGGAAGAREEADASSLLALPRSVAGPARR